MVCVELYFCGSEFDVNVLCYLLFVDVVLVEFGWVYGNEGVNWWGFGVFFVDFVDLVDFWVVEVDCVFDVGFECIMWKVVILCILVGF